MTAPTKPKADDWEIIANQSILAKDSHNNTRTAGITIERRTNQYKMVVILNGGGVLFGPDRAVGRGSSPELALDACSRDAMGIAAGFSNLFDSRLSNAMRCVVYDAEDTERGEDKIKKEGTEPDVFDDL